MSRLLLAVLIGWATYYAPGLMEQVARNRRLSCRECVGYVALNDCRQLGRQVWLYHSTEGWSGPYLNVDCAAPQDKITRERQGYVIEVDWPTARRWGMRGPVPVRVAERPSYQWSRGERK